MGKRIVVKVGSNVLTREDGKLDVTRMSAIVDQIVWLRKHDYEVILVSSGAVAAGRAELHVDHHLDSVEQRQLFSAIGQVKLVGLYYNLFREYKIKIGQVLTMKENFGAEEQYKNQEACMQVMLENNVLPIVNENDTVTVDEIKFGDNDTLAALVSCLVSADLCVTLSDIDGLYTANPHEDPTAEFVPVVHKIDAKIIASAGDSSTSVGTGGMITKIRASRILMTAGIQSVICSGEEPDALVRLACGESVGTLFDPPAERLDIAPRKLWIALGDKAHGSVTVDDGAAKALVSRGSSLLAVGIRQVNGEFAEGDVLDVRDPSGMVLARGIAEADSDVLELAAGRRQDQIASNRLLADLAEKPAIHRDNLIVFA